MMDKPFAIVHSLCSVFALSSPCRSYTIVFLLVQLVDVADIDILSLLHLDRRPFLCL
eukprot:m.79636 g.79636  ORF g.79636 m.79636 type:complete len:57 (+) comp14167_c0_seq1:29-199(+)